LAFAGRTLKYFVVRGAHSNIFWRDVKYVGIDFLFLRVYILEGGVARRLSRKILKL
jgi:hypothetical protein